MFNLPLDYWDNSLLSQLSHHYLHRQGHSLYLQMYVLHVHWGKTLQASGQMCWAFVFGHSLGSETVRSVTDRVVRGIIKRLQSVLNLLIITAVGVLLLLYVFVGGEWMWRLCCHCQTLNLQTEKTKQTLRNDHVCWVQTKDCYKYIRNKCCV